MVAARFQRVPVCLDVVAHMFLITLRLFVSHIFRKEVKDGAQESFGEVDFTVLALMQRYQLSIDISLLSLCLCNSCMCFSF